MWRSRPSRPILVESGRVSRRAGRHARHWHAASVVVEDDADLTREGRPMILGSVRRRLGRSDAQLALRLLADGRTDERQRLEEMLADQGLDSLLDDPRLLTALLRAPGGAHASLPLFCYVVVRQALRRLGEDDRALADFAAAIVMHFGLRDRALRIADADDQVYATLADLLADAERGDPRRSFLVRAHLGHYALWLSGLFP